MDKKGFTLIELLVVIAIISLLVSILLPSLQKAKDLAKTIQCSTQLRSLGLAVSFYANESDDDYPPYFVPAGVASFYGYPSSWAYMWMNLLVYTTDYELGDIWLCPSDTDNPWLSYHYNYQLGHNPVFNPPRKTASVKAIGSGVLIYEDLNYSPSWNWILEFSAGAASQDPPFNEDYPAGLMFKRHPLNESANMLFTDYHVETIDDGAKCNWMP